MRFYEMDTLHKIFKFIFGRIYEQKVESIKNWFNLHRKLAILIFLFIAMCFLAIKLNFIEIVKDNDEPVLVYKVKFNPIKNPATSTQKGKKEDIISAVNPEVLGLNDECRNAPAYCSTFNEEDWVGWSAFKKNEDNPRIIKIVVSRKYDNPNLFYKIAQPGVNFDFELRVVPKNKNKGNIVIVHNKLWRCIIAESNYNTVTCEVGYSSESKNRFVEHLSDGDRQQIKPGTPIVIKGSTLLDSSNAIRLNLNIDYIDTEDSKEKVELEYVLPLLSPDINQKAEVGVGIIDVYGEEIETEFQIFRLTTR